jgi:hypothetical protein
MSAAFTPNATDHRILATLPRSFEALVKALPWLDVRSLRQRIEILLNEGWIDVDASGGFVPSAKESANVSR